MASSPIVIKVKYETILKRFCTSVVDKKLDLDLAMLKDKICRLFSFVSHADFTMTYVDEDGDVVCLDTDDELSEAVRQNLNPMRITIKLNRGSRYSQYHNPFDNYRGNTYGGGSQPKSPEAKQQMFGAPAAQPSGATKSLFSGGGDNSSPFRLKSHEAETRS